MKKSFMTRMLAVSLSAAMTFSLSSASSLTATEAAAKKLPANNKAVSISLKVGNSKVLKLKNYKAWNIKKGATNKKAVAAVANKGTAAKRTIKVTAKKKGTAKVTLTLGKRKTADSKTTKYSKTIKKVVTVKVKAADTTTPTDATDTTPTDTTTPTTPSTTTGSATNVTPGVLHISQANATHVDTIAVSFSSIVVSTGAVKVTVTKGDSTSPMEGTWTWGAGATGGEFKLPGKLTKGTYTVTATDGKDTTTATVEVAEAQEVKEIKFLNEQALTGRGDTNTVGQEAYVYFDVLDQYGDSVRDQFSIQWTASAHVKHVDRATGRITLEKNSSNNKEVFTFADKIYVTGVYTKTGISASETFSVGSEQSVNSIELWGIVKKGDSKRLESLPKDFKANEYQLLYNAFDQNHNQMEADDYLYEGDDGQSRSLTFVSDNVLVVKEVVDNGGKIVTVDGTEYCAANVVPGINVNVGGTVNLSAIATKTGQKSNISVLVGSYRVLKKFELQAPTGYVVDGESIEIPFVAEDADGNRMTLFKELATQSNFSKLSLNQSDGYLTLEENDDGTARLVWMDDYAANKGTWGSNSADGIDRALSLTAIVIGGETSNELIQVADKARPEAISGIDISSVMLDDKDQEINFGKFTFVDQYGRNMKQVYEESKKNHLFMYDGYSMYNNSDIVVYDNGFFENQGVLTHTDFNGYTYGINVTLSGTESGDINEEKTTGFIKDGNKYVSYTTGSPFLFNGIAKYWTANQAKTTSEITVKCGIQKMKSDKSEIVDVGKKFTTSFKIVPLGQLSNYKIGGLNKFHVVTDLSNEDNGQKLADLSGDNTLDIPITNGGKISFGTTTKGAIAELSGGEKLEVVNDQDVKVFGYYNGKEVEIPASHFALDNGGALLTNGAAYALGNRNIKYVLTSNGNNNGLKYKDLYDNSTSHFNCKDAKDTIIAEVYDETVTEVTSASSMVTSLKYDALISDTPSELSEFVGADSYTVRPNKTWINLSDMMFGIDYDGRSYAYASNKTSIVKDQYGVEVYKVTADPKAHAEAVSLSKRADGKRYEDGKLKGGDFAPKEDSNIRFEYLVKDLVENKEGFVDGNLRVVDNASETTSIRGAELGDTFTVEIKAFVKDETNVGIKGSVTKTVKVTVGGDDYCTIFESNNGYAESSSDFNKMTETQVHESGTVRDNLQRQLNDLLGTNDK